MIFVTVGTHNQSFERLVKKADEIAEELDEEVVIQRGHTPYEPEHASFFDFVSRSEMQNVVEKASVVVSHAGAGSIIFALAAGRPLVVVPRLKRYEEHVNDHQLELAKVLEESEKVRAVYDIDELENTLKTMKDIEPVEREKPVMIEVIKNYLERLEK